MNFRLSLERWGTPEFKAALEDELDCQRDEFDFDDYRQKEFAEDIWDSFVVRSFRDSDSAIIADCAIDFHDCAATGCRDMADRERTTAFFTLTIDKETAEGTIEPDREARFNAEYY